MDWSTLNKDLKSRKTTILYADKKGDDRADNKRLKKGQLQANYSAQNQSRCKICGSRTHPTGKCNKNRAPHYQHPRTSRARGNFQYGPRYQPGRGDGRGNGGSGRGNGYYKSGRGGSGFNGGSDFDMSKVRCYRRIQYGHFARDCPNQQPGYYGRAPLTVLLLVGGSTILIASESILLRMLMLMNRRRIRGTTLWTLLIIMIISFMFCVNWKMAKSLNLL